jgi:hypothetical protein
LFIAGTIFHHFVFLPSVRLAPATTVLQEKSNWQSVRIEKRDTSSFHPNGSFTMPASRNALPQEISSKKTSTKTATFPFSSLTKPLATFRDKRNILFLFHDKTVERLTILP